MRIATAMAAASIVAISGCSVTPQDLRGESGKHYYAVIDAETELVYQRINERAKSCLQRTAMVVDSDYFPNSSRGSFVARSVHEVAYTTIFDIEVRRSAPGKTEISGHYLRSAIKDGDAHRFWPELMRDWGSGGNAPCPL